MSSKRPYVTVFMGDFRFIEELPASLRVDTEDEEVLTKIAQDFIDLIFHRGYVKHLHPNDGSLQADYYPIQQVKRLTIGISS